MTHSELERDLEKKSRELMRKLLQEHLEAGISLSHSSQYQMGI